MSEPYRRRNPRKRNAQQMTMFKRAIFALNKNDNNSNTSRPSKRARIGTNNESNDLNQNTNNNNSNNNSNNHPIHRPSQSKSFNSFSKPQPRSPPRNFLHDEIRHNNHNNNSPKSLQSIRHTPKTRLLHQQTVNKNKNIHISTRKHRQNNTRRSHNHNHNNNHNTNYNYVEQCRMKKLWTDLSGNDSILSQLHFCRDTSFFITSNSIAHKISYVIKLLLTEYFANKNVKFTNQTQIKILDGLSCIGGNTYSFAKIFSGKNHKIYANELDKERYHALKHNMRVFAENGFICNDNDKYHFYNMDFNELHNALNESCMDVIFLDPEWNNGDDYKQTDRGQIHLFDIGGLHLYQVIDNILSKWYENVKIIAIKVAKNYDQEFIHRKLQKCKLIAEKMYRVGEVGFHNQKLIVIVKSFEDVVVVVDEDEDDDVKQKQSGLSFEEIFKCLPKMINKNNFGNSRDVITVEVLS